MNKEFVEYPEQVLPRLRYRHCPMCQSTLTTGIIDDDNIRRVRCPACGWVHYPANAVGVNVVVRFGENGLVALLPPNEPLTAPAALPSGHVEYGESPEEAAVREVREETGLVVKVVCALGWQFYRNAGYPGPMVSFFFEAQAVSGQLSGSQEGQVRVYPIKEFPPISPNRGGSQAAFAAFKKYYGL